ncbi:tol-pal system-associated acyl-CoA thioesterase [Rhodobacterales bacterium HKCCE2091]|nr:tol-pal system-associated acyl-CoA thioesterase [Rhodobacterales bacterium HKCCE2091]
MTHHWPIRVYYEDTDFAGIVYYANYLKFIERARSELVRAAGIDQAALKAGGIAFAVRRLEADYLAPARYDDELTVTTGITRLTGARFDLDQSVARGAETLFAAKVQVVCLSDSGRPARLPEDVRRKIAQYCDVTGA